MRKRYRVLMLLAVVGFVAVPFGFALSLDSTDPVRADESRQADFSMPLVPECAELALAGGLLFGAAALVRRAA
ncbi:MAG TPA: hypothetical protein VHZ73_08795 [Vicinamibacterales bacterium]|nr:hypothetical protein [Vicinamibacterales bacterium]